MRITDGEPKPTGPSPRHGLTASGRGWYKRVGGRPCWVCGFRQAPTGELADAIFEEKFKDLARPRERGERLTLLDLGDLFLQRKRVARDSNRLDSRTVQDYEDSLQLFLDTIGDSRTHDTLTPQDFARFADTINARFGVHRRLKHTINVRSWFNWLLAMKLIGELPAYGPEFKLPTRTELRKRRAESRASHGGALVYSPAEIKRLLKHASTVMRAMILMTLNGGFRNKELATLRRSSIQGSIVRATDSKRSIDREVTLWPETAAAVKKVLALSRPDFGHSDLVFITRFGKPYIVSATRKDQIGDRFNVLCNAAGVTSHGFYSLRRTFRTIADETNDQRAIARIMGRELRDIDTVYVQNISLKRLQAVTDHVRRRLGIAGVKFADRARAVREQPSKPRRKRRPPEKAKPSDEPPQQPTRPS